MLKESIDELETFLQVNNSTLSIHWHPERRKWQAHFTDAHGVTMSNHYDCDLQEAIVGALLVAWDATPFDSPKTCGK